MIGSSTAGNLFAAMLIASGGLAAGGFAALLVADGPETAKVSAFAPAAELSAQARFFGGRIEQALAAKDAYDETRQSQVLLDASTLAVLGLVLGMHDEDHDLKKSAPAIVKAAQSLGENHPDYDRAVAAWAQLKPALAGEAAGAVPPKWEVVAEMGPLMKQVPIVHTMLTRVVDDQRRFKRQAAEAAAQATTLAAIAQAAWFDTSLVADDADSAAWHELCLAMRDESAAAAQAIRAGDRAAAGAAVERLNRNCEACHEKFR